MAVIHIGPEHLARLRSAAEAAYPGECCGILVGRSGGGDFTVTGVEPSANVAPTGAPDRFEVDPTLHFRLLRGLRGGADAIIGHYHSHPDHEAEPSAADRARAYEPEMVWLITAVAAGKAGASRAFVIGAHGAVTELEVVEDGGRNQAP